MTGTWAHRAILFVCVLLHFLLAYHVDRTQSVAVLGIFGLLWVVFFVQWKYWKTGIWQLIALAMLLRSVYLLAIPELSDDVFRYIWDGWLSVNGVSPYEWVPSEWIARTDDSTFGQLYPLLNSPDYYSIYPPVLQFFYAAAAWLGQGNVHHSIVILRLFVLFAEFGSILLVRQLLKAWGMDARGLLLYAFNPLVIVEFSGNLHNEVFMVFTLLLCMLLLAQNRMVLSSLAFAASVGTKLLPLMFLPFLIRRIGIRWSVLIGTVIGFGVMLMYMPLHTRDLVANNLESLSLYFADFEFNASIYYVVRHIGYHVTGYNIIASTAVWLPCIVIVSILLLAFLNRRNDLASLPMMMLFAWAIYYALATTVHPWYIAVLGMFIPFTAYRFGLAWMVLVPLSYHAYAGVGFQEDLWIVAVEYGVVLGVFLHEMKTVWQARRKWG